MATTKKTAGKKSTSKAKAKAEEADAKQLPKNPNQYSYRGDEDLIIKASEFLALAEALEIAVQNGTDVFYPTQLKYIASATGIDVPNPSEEEIKKGAVRAMMDVEGTFDQGNINQNYQAWLVPKVIDAKTKIFDIHARNVKDGRAVEHSILQKEAQEMQEKQKAAQAAAQADAPQGPGPISDMEVVTDN